MTVKERNNANGEDYNILSEVIGLVGGPVGVIS